MLPPRLIKHIGWRVKLMALGIGTYYRWDDEKEQLLIAHPYQYYAMVTQFGAGFSFITIQAVQLYVKIYDDDGILDEGVNLAPSHEGLTAPLIVGIGELLLVICTTFLNVVSVQRIDTQMYLINQLIIYNRASNEMIKSGKLTLEPEHKKKIRMGEFIIYFGMISSIFIPFAVILALLHPLEPTHVIIREWLEVEFQLRGEFLPLIVEAVIVLYGAGTTIVLMALNITMFYIFASVTVDALTPDEVEAVGPRKERRCRVITKGFGALEDETAVHLYRTQQILNLLLNEFFKSVLISYHHVGILATATCLICFAIGHHDVLSDEGVVGYLVVFTCIGMCFALILFQSGMAGEVVDVSDGFADQGKKVAGRTMRFHKFCRSCQTFYIQVAYPFYTVGKETFLQFCEQVLNYVLTMLL